MDTNEEYIEQPHFYCALGAQQTVSAITKAVPIAHAGPGCCYKLYRALGMNGGYQGLGYAGGSAIPCTNSSEKEVVFGGENRLREVIDGALKVLDGDLYVVLTGCTADIVGDDVGSVVKEFRENGIPIVNAETGGFKGSNYLGHEIVIKAIVEQLVGAYDGEKEPGLVNVFSSIPHQHVFWAGDLMEIKRLLAGIGLKANILFGPQSGGVEEWKSIPRAQFNLVLSPWVGVRTAKYLERKYKTPFLHIPELPIGGDLTAAFLRNVAEFAGVDNEKSEAFIRAELDDFYYYLDRAADFFIEFRYGLPTRYFCALDSHYALGISRFLSDELGLQPVHQFIVDEVPEKYREKLRDSFRRLTPSLGSEITVTTDGEAIAAGIRGNLDPIRKTLVVGSSWEKDLTALPGVFLLTAGIPVSNRLVLNGTYAGFRGGMRLIEDIYFKVLDIYQ